MTEPKSQFTQALSKALDDGLLILGESGREAIYFHLQNLYSLNREDIPEKLETFVEGIAKMFGVGAEVIERSIVKSLYYKLGLEYKEKKGYSFLEYLNDAKHMAK